MDITTFLKNADQYILNPIILLLFGLATVYFLYSVVKYVSLDPSDAAGRKETQNAIIWGLVGMLIMFSVYGLIGFVLNTFGIQPSEVMFINTKLQ